MTSALLHHRNEIAALCRRYGVQKLDLFGSAVSPEFEPDRSDYDFVLEFTHYGPDSARRFIKFADAMEELLGRPVDIVFERALKPRFRDFISDQRATIFERSDRSVAA